MDGCGMVFGINGVNIVNGRGKIVRGIIPAIIVTVTKQQKFN